MFGTDGERYFARHPLQSITNNWVLNEVLGNILHLFEVKQKFIWEHNYATILYLSISEFLIWFYSMLFLIFCAHKLQNWRTSLQTIKINH